MSLRDLLTDDHRHCDDLFAAAEQAAGDGRCAQAATAFASFTRAMLDHFSVEEEALFPAFEARTGMTQGPTQVMRHEHAQMRDLLNDAVDALEKGKTDDFLGIGETLLIMMQQHNMKEENVLYPMCDQQLADQAGELAERIHGALQR